MNKKAKIIIIIIIIISDSVQNKYKIEVTVSYHTYSSMRASASGNLLNISSRVATH